MDVMHSISSRNFMLVAALLALAVLGLSLGDGAWLQAGLALVVVALLGAGVLSEASSTRQSAEHSEAVAETVDAALADELPASTPRWRASRGSSPTQSLNCPAVSTRCTA